MGEGPQIIELTIQMWREAEGTYSAAIFAETEQRFGTLTYADPVAVINEVTRDLRVQMQHRLGELQRGERTFAATPAELRQHIKQVFGISVRVTEEMMPAAGVWRL